MPALSEILEKIDRHRSEIKRFGVKKLGIFGSVARGDGTETSDVDVLVQLERETFDDYMGLILFLEDLFGTPVDVVIQHTIKDSLRDRILDEVMYVEGF